jgi:hypothetical protein
MRWCPALLRATNIRDEHDDVGMIDVMAQVIQNDRTPSLEDEVIMEIFMRGMRWKLPAILHGNVVVWQNLTTQLER